MQVYQYSKALFYAHLFIRIFVLTPRTNLHHVPIRARFNLQAPCVLYVGQAFRYSPQNAFYIFNQQIYFII